MGRVRDGSPATVRLAARGRDRERRAVVAQEGVAPGRADRAAGVEHERAGARVAGAAVVALDGEESGAVEREVERVARLDERAGRHVGELAGDARALGRALGVQALAKARSRR